MIAPARAGRDEYAPSLAGYVARIADDEDVVAVLIAGHVRHHFEVLDTRYGE